jgi:hypothetical protein
MLKQSSDSDHVCAFKYKICAAVHSTISYVLCQTP